jgi:N-acetylmuramic acid 6-phosphate (MurNAc-6-P) etherase
VKLRDRAIRIVQELTGCSSKQARGALEKNRWIVKNAWAQVRQDAPKRP